MSHAATHTPPADVDPVDDAGWAALFKEIASPPLPKGNDRVNAAGLPTPFALEGSGEVYASPARSNTLGYDRSYSQGLSRVVSRCLSARSPHHS
jgi:hypothetical protein